MEEEEKVVRESAIEYFAANALDVYKMMIAVNVDIAKIKRNSEDKID